MANVAGALEEDLDNMKNRLTMAKLTLQSIINKQNSDPDIDYSARINFARFNLERISGSKVKLKGE